MSAVGKKTLLSLVVLLYCLSSVGLAQTGSGLRDDIRRNRENIGEVKKKLGEANRREKEVATKLIDARRRMDKAEAELAETESALGQAEDKLATLKSRIRKTSVQLLRAQRALEGRLKEIYIEGEVSYLAVLLQSDDFTDFLNQAEYLKLIVKSDSELISSVKHHKGELDTQKSEAQETVITLAQLRAKQKDSVDRIARLRDAQQDLLSRLQVYQDKLSARIDDLEEITAQKEAQLRVFLQGYYTPGSVPVPRSSGRFIYPVNGPVTSHFGYRVHPIHGTTRLHAGTDFGVGYGVPILAADNGVVIHAGWYGGYGNTVILDHGGGLTTLYAHASSVAVSQGQTVKQGQTLSYVGTTGFSTGPHLHFEVRYNGNPVDPLSHL